MRGPLIIHVRMDINEYYRKLLAEGCSLGHAQWIYARHHLEGIDAPKDPDIAEAWFDRAWRNGFPGTASTQTFQLQRKWARFVDYTYARRPRLRALLKEAELKASEQVAHITFHPHNDAQSAWLKEKSGEIMESFRKFSFGRFVDTIVRIECPYNLPLSTQSGQEEI